MSILPSRSHWDCPHREKCVKARESVPELKQRIATLETATHAEANEAALTRFAARCEGLEARVRELDRLNSKLQKRNDWLEPHLKGMAGICDREKARADKAESDKEYWREAGVNRTQETMDLRKQCRALEAERETAVAERDRLMEALIGMVDQHCPSSTSGVIDSYAISANADALHLLAGSGHFAIQKSFGRRVIGKWATLEPSDGQ